MGEMTKEQWINQARANADDLRSLVSEYHPTRVSGRKQSHRRLITAPNAEAACRNVRSTIVEEQKAKPDPVERFDAALKIGDWAEVSGLLSDAWFGVPESTSCWRIRGFSAAVDLMDDPPEDEAIEGEAVEVPPATAFACGPPRCADGEHKMDGPVVQRGNMGSVSCSKCGALAFDVDTFMGGAD
jgi:hypothetical protein